MNKAGFYAVAALPIGCLLTHSLSPSNPFLFRSAGTAESEGEGVRESVTEAQSRVASFAEVFEWVDSVELEQTDLVLNVSPRLTPDVQGGWIVVDPPEHQVRLYDRSGRLKAHYGRKGDGPGEFRRPVGAVRTGTGVIVVVDEAGRFTALSSDASRRLYEFNVRLNNITDVQLLRGDSILVITTPVRNHEPILHLVDVSAGKLVRSFHPLLFPPHEAIAWVTVHGARIGTNGDTIGFTLPLLDSLMLLRRDGSFITSRPLHLLRENPPAPTGTITRRDFMEWMQRSALVGSMQANGAGWLIPRTRVRSQTNPDLLFYPRNGTVPVLIRNAPVLIGTSSGNEFVFDDPDRLEPQFVRIARVRATRE